jgi:cytochrome b561
MGSFSIFHWLIIIVIIGLVVYFASGEKSPAPKHIRVNSKAELFNQVQKYAAQCFQTVMDRGHIIVLNKKVPFNWVLFIVLLFIPIIGWIALLMLLFANKSKIQTVTIEAPETTGA